MAFDVRQIDLAKLNSMTKYPSILIYDRTLRIPFPYTEMDADGWFDRVAKIIEQQGRPVNFAIRSADDSLIGGCGFHGGGRKEVKGDEHGMVHGVH